MNKAYTYKHIELWNEEQWAGHTSALAPLINEIVGMEKTDPRERVIDESEWEKFNDPSCYHTKTGSMNVPSVIRTWEEMGLIYEDRELGHIRWIVIQPSVRPVSKRKALFVVHREDYTSPFWALRTLEKFHSYQELAVNNDMVIVYMVMENPSEDMMFVNIIMETISLYFVDPKEVYLDLTPIYVRGKQLKDVQNFHMKTEDGTLIDDADGETEMLEDGLPVLNIHAIWANNKTNNFFQLQQCGNKLFNADWLIKSETGKHLAYGMTFEYAYSSPKQPEFQALLDKMGLQYGEYHVKDQRYVIAAPSEPTNEKLPLVCIFQEVNDSNDHLILSAFGQFVSYVELAAEGELIALFFALESPEDNDLLRDMITDAAKRLPIDLTRVYVTGHSHNGHFTREFAYRNSDIIAAAAPLGNYPGLPSPEESGEAVLVTDERIEQMSQIDMPLINISGYAECGEMFPLNQDAKNLLPGQEYMCPLTAEKRAKTWRRRLKASRCPDRSIEEILKTVKSEDRVERLMGIPADRTDILMGEGFEHYIADIKNCEGRYHLRIVGIENMPHMPLPYMQRLSWSYMKRFARDLSTGEVIEL